MSEHYEPLPGMLGLPRRLWRDASPAARRAAVVAAVVLLAGIAIATPLIAARRSRLARDERRSLARAVAAERVRLAADQAPRRATVTRAGVVTLERMILADARGRVRAGTLPPPPAESVRCGPTDQLPVATAHAARAGARLERCVAYVARSARVGIGVEFIGWLQPRTGRITWCKTNAPAGEALGGARLARVELARSCYGPR